MQYDIRASSRVLYLTPRIKQASVVQLKKQKLYEEQKALKTRTRVVYVLVWNSGSASPKTIREKRAAHLKKSIQRRPRVFVLISKF
jgi:hypothetical protein